MAVNEHASVETRCFIKTKQTAYFVILVNALLQHGKHYNGKNKF